MNEEIFQLNWTKRWASRFSLLSCSYWGLQYIKIAKRDLGEGFKHILFTHKDGITTCYRVKEETINFGEYLANKAILNSELLIEWSENLKKQADKIRSLISEPIINFLDQNRFELFEQEFDRYYPFAGANNTVSDFLPPNLLDKYRGVLEEARKYSESVYNEADDFFRRFIKHVAEEEGYNAEYLLTIFRDELSAYLTDGILPDQNTLESRYKRSALYFNESGLHFISEDEVELLETSIINQSKVTKKEISGKTACSGKVIGVVRIIKDPKNYGAFNNGDILVTGMTRPDFVPLMKKAGAVVTDAGGILSHAAIVSRELNIPCIIGTEVATNIFKDGDVVEVDADNGVVRIIK